MSPGVVGARVARNEDPALLRGEGVYLDDVDDTGALHAAFVRSPLAHARIGRIDADAARALPGVVAVYTCEDLGELDIPLPVLISHPELTARTQRPLAHGKVHYAGETIAMVVAVDRYVAEDALELIEVDYEPLPPVIDLEGAVAEGADLVHEDVPGNLAGRLVQRSGDPDRAFAEADVVIRERFTIERSAGMPLETRGVLARYDARVRTLTVWDSTQAPHPIRDGLAAMLGLAERDVRVIAPEIGGGFGTKVMMFYPEEVLVPWAAMQLATPVKWVEDRVEHFVGSTHERKQVHDVELAAMRDGTVVGLRDSFVHDSGAYAPYGLTVAETTAGQIAGIYRIPNLEVELRVAYTNTVPVVPYRGNGRPQACTILELGLDRLAEELGMDRAELRRRNFVPRDDFPYARPGLDLSGDAGLPVTLDSGDYDPLLEQVLDGIGYAGFAEEQRQAASEGRLIGLGLAVYVESTGAGPYEGAHVQVHPDGKVYASTGVSTQGQSHKTTFAQIVAEQLSVDPADVVVTTGDTAAFPYSIGTWMSRAAVVSGNAMDAAAAKVRTKAFRLAANMLEAAEEDLELADGALSVKGSPERKVTLQQIAGAADPMRYAWIPGDLAPAFRDTTVPLPADEEPGLEATGYYSPPAPVWAGGVHAAVIELDPETFEVSWLRYVCSHDCGTMINPTVVEGQVIGGIAQGIGGALYERMQYDEEGQLRNASLMDFLMPYATEVPSVVLHHRETPSPYNKLGIKGVGEAGAIPAPAVFASAVQDALRGTGARVTEVPLSPSRIHALATGAADAEKVDAGLV